MIVFEIQLETINRQICLASTNENDIVFDPYSGTGTTCKAAKDNNRRYLGFEISDLYCEMSKERISK